MLDSCLKIKRYTDRRDFDDFLNDEKTIDAVACNFEIIGEAADRLDKYFKEIHTSINWDRLRGFCNRIVHEYFGIDYGIVWTIIGYRVTP